MFQHTIKSDFFLNGVGVHTGLPCSVTVKPASDNTGIIFILKDLNDFIPANYLNVSNTSMCTQLTSAKKNHLMTVEHISAALYAMNISNAIIEVTGPEIPILDGSAKLFVEKIQKNGIKQQATKRSILKILHTLRLEQNSDWAEFSPADNNEFSINIECNYQKKGLKTSPFQFNFSTDDFVKEIAPARTFGFLEDLNFMKNNKLACGASLQNSVVFNKNGLPINDSLLRFDNEPIRHKILDIVGDFSLSQYKIVGKFNGFCTSHKLNHAVLRNLLENKKNFDIIE